jgi:hypothetical protein
MSSEHELPLKSIQWFTSCYIHKDGRTDVAILIGALREFERA